MTIDKYTIIDSVRALRNMLNSADPAVLDAAYQWAANQANDSDYAHTIEPMSYLAQAFQAEHRRRLYNESQTCNCDQTDQIQCIMHGPRE